MSASERDREIGFARGYQAASTEMQADLDDLSRNWDIDIGSLRVELARLRAQMTELQNMHEQAIKLIGQTAELLAVGRYDEAKGAIIAWRQKMNNNANTDAA